MIIRIGIYTGEKAVLDKWRNTREIITVSDAIIRGEIDIANPTIQLNRAIPAFYNYAKIDDFGGYYYIPETNRFRRDMSVLTLQRDPLQTFAGGIKASPAIAARASDDHVNADYPDNRYKTLQSTYTSVYPIGNLGLTHSIIFGFVK